MVWTGVLATALLASEFTHFPAVSCREFADCMRQVPAGKIVATTVYLADMADYAAMNQVYQAHFPGLKPARNTVEVQLPEGDRMAIDATLYNGTPDPRGLTPPNVTNPVPITPGILTPNHLFIAGILGRDSNSGQIPTAPDAQIELCLQRLTRVLSTANLLPSAMLQATVYHSAAIPRPHIDTQLKLYFGDKPTIAITIVEVSAMALGANIAINGIALILHTGV